MSDTPKEPATATVTSILRVSAVHPVVSHPILAKLKAANLIIQENHIDIVNLILKLQLPIVKRVIFLQTIVMIQAIALIYLFSVK